MGRGIGGDWDCVRLRLVIENYLPRSAKGDPQGQDQPAGSDDGKTPGIQRYGGRTISSFLRPTSGVSGAGTAYGPRRC